MGKEARIFEFSVSWQALQEQESKLVRIFQNNLVIPNSNPSVRSSEIFDLPPSMQPILRNHEEGRFYLDVVNEGSSIMNSVLCFCLKDTQQADKKSGEKIVNPDVALSVLPFAQLFMDKLTATQVLFQKSLQQDTPLVESDLEKAEIVAAFRKAEYCAKSNVPVPQAEQLLLKQCLGRSLEAQDSFYDRLWEGLMKVYTPAVMYAATIDSVRDYSQSYEYAQTLKPHEFH